MRTKTITLFYPITQTEVQDPSTKELERKDAWIKEVQGTVEAEWKPKLLKVAYSLYNPEIENQVRFFNGTCVLYYAVQNMDMTTGTPDTETLKMYREEMLDEVLGFDYKTVHKIIHQRKSTTDFKTVAAWNTFLQTLEETLFDSAGYEFPDSKEFWEAVKVHGHDKAQQISISQLQARMKKRV